MNSRSLIVNHQFNLTDRRIIRVCRRYINDFAQEIKRHMDLKNENPEEEDYKFSLETVAGEFKSRLLCELPLTEEAAANYVIDISYSSMSISKSLAWSAFSQYILKNLRASTDPKKSVSIREVSRKTDNSYEYLGKYYEFEEGESHIQEC